MLGPDSQELLKGVEAGDSRAAAAVFNRYADRLLALVRARIGKKLARRIDADDVVQSAYHSFFAHAENGEFSLSAAGDLWRLLARITLNKLYSQVERQTAARRNVFRESEANPTLPSGRRSIEPTAADVVALTEQLQIVVRSLSSMEQALFARLLRGETNEVIAHSIKKSPRTVRRLLAQLQAKIENKLLSIATPAGRAASDRAEGRADDRAKLSFSDFRLERLIGSGGMGKVYQARQHSTGRHVAIKSLVKSRQADVNCVNKFLEEGRILATFDHPNIVGFRGVGRFPGGGHFIVMEFIDGTDLQARISKRPMPIEEALCVMRDVSRAIAHAHERGVAHGDIKPANVLIDRANRVVVTDFGLAQLINAHSDHNRWLVGGTAGYFAPEVRSLGTVPGIAADIYSLGALLWALVTGSAPAFPLDLDCSEGVLGSILVICRKCMAAEPRLRFSNAGVLMHALENCVIVRPST